MQGSAEPTGADEILARHPPGTLAQRRSDETLTRFPVGVDEILVGPSHARPWRASDRSRADPQRRGDAGTVLALPPRMQIPHHVLALVCVTSLFPACAMPGPLPGDEFDDEGTLDDEALDESGDRPEADELTFLFTIDGSSHPTTVDQASVLELGAVFEPGIAVEALEFWVDDELILDSPDAPRQAWWMAASAAQNGPHRFVARAWTEDGRHAETTIDLELALPAPGKSMWTLGASELGPTRALAQLGDGGLMLLDDDGVRRVSADAETLWRLDLPFQARALTSAPFVGTLHAVGVYEETLVDARIDAAGELVELVELGPTPEALQIDSVDADAERLAIAGSWQEGAWLGVFGLDGTPRWSSTIEIEGDDAGRSAVVLVPSGSFALVDVLDQGDQVPHPELLHHDASGSLEFAIALEPGSRSLALALDADEAVIVGTRDDQGNARLTRFSSQGLPLGEVTLYEADTIALARWRGHEGIQVAIGGVQPSAGRMIDDAAIWGVEVDALAGMQPLSLVVDDLGYTFALFAEDREGNEPLLVRLHP
ncbi:hypothetical protein ACNOYE_21805 [Nannocystaceae bacterium ST9]